MTNKKCFIFRFDIFRLKLKVRNLLFLKKSVNKSSFFLIRFVFKLRVIYSRSFSTKPWEQKPIWLRKWISLIPFVILKKKNNLRCQWHCSEICYGMWIIDENYHSQIFPTVKVLQGWMYIDSWCVRINIKLRSLSTCIYGKQHD